MATVSWDMHVVLLLHFSPPNETVNSAAYQATLTKLKEAVQRKRPQMSTSRCCCCMTMPDRIQLMRQ